MDAARVIADLRELDRRTGGPGGARRVCWTDEWAAAREFLRELLAELPAEVSVDAAGNLWALVAGASDEVVAVGSHIDSVPAGGWLDGALGVMAAVEVLRSLDSPARSVALVDWADEEGARFGRSLLGSSAFAGTLDPAAVRDLTDADGVTLADALAAHGVSVDEMASAGAGTPRVAGRLPRAAHRAGPGARGRGARVRGGARHRRRGAPPGRVRGPRRRTPAPRRWTGAPTPASPRRA